MQTGSETGFRFRRNPFHSFCRLHANRFCHRFQFGSNMRFARLDRNGACKRSLKTSQNGFHVPSPNSFSPVLGVLNANRLPFQVETAPERS